MHRLWICFGLACILISGCGQQSEQISGTGLKTVHFDLDSILTRDTLRVLSRNNTHTYLLHRGAEMGFEYELISEFANRLGVHVRMVIPPDWDDMTSWLLAGKGDVIAAAMTATASRKGQVRFCEPYNTVYQVVLTRTDSDSIKTPEDLSGRQVHVRLGSSYFASLIEINAGLASEGKDTIRVVPIPEKQETETIIRSLADGKIDITIADINIALMETSFADEALRINCRISADQKIAWAVRPDADSLAMQIDAYIDEIYGRGRSAFYNILYRKYYSQPKRYTAHSRSVSLLQSEGRLSAFDDLFKQHGKQHGFDWKLVAAQAYQESRFNPRAKSWVGALGIMQIMPRTARELGLTDPYNPSQSIEGGVRYLRRMYDRFDASLEPDDRLAFALASYNMGYGHVRDARKLAEEDGLNPDRWGRNVEAMTLNLSREAYHQRAKSGYARGLEAVRYVGLILKRWEAYSEVLPDKSALPTS